MPTLNKDGRLRKLKPLIHEFLSESEGGIQCTLCLDFLTPQSFIKRSPPHKSFTRNCRECLKTRREELKEGKRITSSRLYSEKRKEILFQKHKWNREHPRELMLISTQARSRRFNIPCTITLKDIVIPERCPVFGFPLVSRDMVSIKRKSGAPNSPSIDRIIPALGYIPGNVQVISLKANMMKSSRSPKEWEQFARWILYLIDKGGLA